MSILITGGSGWIGTGLAHRLAARGEDLILFDNVPEPGRVGDIMDKVRIVRGDVKVWPEVMNPVKENGVEGIFHLSGLNSSASDLTPGPRTRQTSPDRCTSWRRHGSSA